MSVPDEEGLVGKSASVISDLGGPQGVTLWKDVQEKPRSEDQMCGRTETDTGRQDEYSQARERTLLKELGKLAP